MKKQYTIQQIAEHLSSHQTFDHITGSRFGYYLHIDEAGHLLPDLDGEATCFIAEYPEVFDDVDDVYARETLDDEAFHSVCEEMTRKVNAWLTAHA